ncbi:hypothetical protein ISS04_01730 [Candidatus Woesearchaeota archaeon]|nr:hypothetical protein [Candidatus Woesearchaeota archaeon]
MKITIDTKTDSQEEIKKAIKLLESLLSSSMPLESNTIEKNPGMFNMFGDSSSSTESPPEESVPPVTEYDRTEPEIESVTKSGTFNIKELLDD